MLGYWNKSVYITYIGAFVAVVGVLLSYQYNNIDFAFCGMIIAAVCDMFDGKIARGLKRTNQEKEFGVQIDSLADVVAFITVPMITLYFFGLREIYHIVLMGLYVVSGIVRLAYFNVAMSDKNKAIASYTGLPVPVSVLIFGTVWIFDKIFSFNSILVYTILIPITGYLHISKIKIKKPTSNYFYIGITILALLGIILAIIF